MSDYPSSFFPIPERYIVVSNSGPPAKQYSYLEESLNFIHSELEKSKTSVIQIGSPEDRYINGCIDFRGKLNLNQISFVILNSLCLISSDNVYIHLVQNTPFIVLNSVFPIEESVPHYKNGLVLEPLRAGVPPSRDLNDKIINTIKPEDVSNAICKQLGFDKEFEFETVSIGNQYLNRCLEYIPDFDVNPNDIQGLNSLVCRMDVYFDLFRLQNVLSFTKVRILSSQEIPLEILLKFKENIVEYALIADDVDEDYVKSVVSSGVSFVIFCENVDKINDLKLKFFGICFVLERKFEDLEEKSLDNLYFLSNKHYLGRGKIYPSIPHYLTDTPISNSPLKIGNAVKNKEFILDKEHFYILNKK